MAARPIAWTDEEALGRKGPRRSLRPLLGPAAVLTTCFCMISGGAYLALQHTAMPNLPLAASLNERIATVTVSDPEGEFKTSRDTLQAALDDRIARMQDSTIVMVPVEDQTQVAAIVVPKRPEPVVARVSPPAATSSISAIQMALGMSDRQAASSPAMAMSFAPSNEPSWVTPTSFEVPIPTERPEFVAEKKPTATISRSVNFRSGPNRGKVLGVLARSTVVELEESECRQWCKITADGKSGYVYRSYLRIGRS